MKCPDKFGAPCGENSCLRCSPGYDDLRAEVEELRAERDDLRTRVAGLESRIAEFANGQAWACDGWKNIVHIAPLFEIANEVRSRKQETKPRPRRKAGRKR